MNVITLKKSKAGSRIPNIECGQRPTSDGNDARIDSKGHVRRMHEPYRHTPHETGLVTVTAKRSF